MSSTRSLPEYLSTTTPSARNTKEGTVSTPNSRAISAVSAFLSIAIRAHRVNPCVFLARESTAGKMWRHPCGASLSTPMSTMASCLSHGTSMPASKPGMGPEGAAHDSIKLPSEERELISVT